MQPTDIQKCELWLTQRPRYQVDFTPSQVVSALTCPRHVRGARASKGKIFISSLLKKSFAAEAGPTKKPSSFGTRFRECAGCLWLPARPKSASTCNSFPKPHNWHPGPTFVPAITRAEESANRGKTRKGSVWLRRALCEAAWAALRAKNTYLSAQYRRIAAKRGQKRASLAVVHTILVIAYHRLKNKACYQELSADYFDRIRTAGLKRYYLKRLEQLGVSVTESPAASDG